MTLAQDIARTHPRRLRQALPPLPRAERRGQVALRARRLGGRARGGQGAHRRCTTSASARRSTVLRETLPGGRGATSRSGRRSSSRTSACSTSTCQPECAETFYNSVACRVLDRRYYRQRVHLPAPGHLDRAPRRRGAHLPLLLPAQAGTRARPSASAHRLRPREPLRGPRSRRPPHRPRACASSSRARGASHDNFQIQVLSSLFFRNKAAYMVGRRDRTGATRLPFVMPLLRTSAGRGLRRHAAAQAGEHRARLQPRALVLHGRHGGALRVRRVPQDHLAEQAEGRALHDARPAEAGQDALLPRPRAPHAALDATRSSSRRGREGMVMVVFTCPSFPYVFKVIRDWFEPPKDTDRRTRAGEVPPREVPRPRRPDGRHARVLERRPAARSASTRRSSRSSSGSRRRRSRSTATSSSSVTSTSSGA